MGNGSRVGAVVVGALVVAGFSDAPAGAEPPLRASPRPVVVDTGGRVRLVPAGDGNEARYRVRERLAELDLPNDAVGKTAGITGGIVLDERGALVPGESKFVIDLASLTSDRERRDRYLRNRVLETERFPTAGLVVTALHGVPAPLPASGSMTFQLVGNFTVRGVTRPTTWQVTAQTENGVLSGSAATSFTFEDFNLTKPSLAFLLSVDDRIKLEYDFRLVREGGEAPEASRARPKRRSAHC